VAKASSKASSKANSKASSRKVNKVAKVVSRLCLTNKRIQAAHPRLPGDCSSRRQPEAKAVTRLSAGQLAEE
jgi:hypothetical protein